MKKHGIHIYKHKKHQTKKIYNNNYLMVKYLYQPHSIEFKSKMVNDMNQHFCGGWRLNDLDLSDRALLKRVLDGNKPMAIVLEWDEKYLQEFDKSKFYVEEVIYKNTKRCVVGCRGKLKELFDLETLQKDYSSNGIDINVSQHKDKMLKDFFWCWDFLDDPNIDFWLTGLILGYPVENTISIYNDGVR